MNGEQPRSWWNIVALVATLGLAAVVAVVAVTRSDRAVPRAENSPSVSPSPTASPTAPGKLAGRGPYIVYASGTEVFAYDTAAKQWVTMGNVDQRPLPQTTRQPGSGLVVAFSTLEGTVWRVDRQGLERIALLPVTGPGQVDGGAVSRDGRRFAIRENGPAQEMMVVNLGNGRTATLPYRAGSGSRLPEDAQLVPVGWSLGGSLVYQLPVCYCEDSTPGLYLYDVQTERITLVPATSQEFLYRSAISPDGQEVVWGDGRSLQRLAAGRRSIEILRRVPSGSFVNDALWSTDGASILVGVGADRFPGSGDTLELSDAETGDRIGTLDAFPENGTPVALLAGRLVVVDEGGSKLSTYLDGTVATLAQGEDLVYLGWIR